ncbi:MAG: N-acetylmuramoyl-L-alanine amidase [Actinobacteria bacterium]|nr:N-acetylmuramoyl-L-alanine amidase [Actinomycetota bacterium]
MCEECFSRRDLLIGGSFALAAAGLARGRSGATAHADSLPDTAMYTPADLPAIPPVNVAPGLDIYPRDAWGADLPAKSAITTGEDVRFLLVHHTASPNKPAVGGTSTVLRQTYWYQTGKAKQWPDVCYEFFVDRDGVVWEGRTGSLAGPVVADATGGSQGFAQLVCLVGNFTKVLPTAAQQTSLVRTLAWLADRYAIDTNPGATTSFVSRGSNRFKAGVTVTAKTISGHRDTSRTACPGNKFYPVVRSNMQAMVTAERAQMAAAANGGFPFRP